MVRQLLVSFAAMVAIRTTAWSQAVEFQQVPVVQAPVAPITVTMPGRENDARVARLAFRLASAGRARCQSLVRDTGIVWQHLTQFDRADRAGLIASQALDRGPKAIVVVAGGPGDVAGVYAGDVLLAIRGIALPSEPGVADRFDAARARARADEIEDLIAGPDAPVSLTLLRASATVTVRLTAPYACPTHVHLARSAQNNAYADGQHVFLTTGLMARLPNDDELAFVIAHEMAHNILGHPALLRARGTEHGGGHTLRDKALTIRETELAADALAGELMLDAGFDPVVGVGALNHIGSQNLGLATFTNHPSNTLRMARMRALVLARRTAR